MRINFNFLENPEHSIRIFKFFMYTTYIFFLMSFVGNMLIPGLMDDMIYFFYLKSNYESKDLIQIAFFGFIIILVINIFRWSYRSNTEEYFQKSGISSNGIMTQEKWLKVYENFKHKYEIAYSKHRLSKLQFFFCYIVVFVLIIFYLFSNFFIDYNGYTLLSIFNLLCCCLIKLQKKLESIWSYPLDCDQLRYNNRILFYLFIWNSLFIPFINEWYKYLDVDLLKFLSDIDHKINSFLFIYSPYPFLFSIFTVFFLIPRLKVLFTELKLEGFMLGTLDKANNNS